MTLLSQVLQVSRSGFYAWRPPAVVGWSMREGLERQNGKARVVQGTINDRLDLSFLPAA